LIILFFIHILCLCGATILGVTVDTTTITDHAS
jgi:hypothetical protein